MKIVMSNDIRLKFEDDLNNAQALHEYWIAIEEDTIIIEFFNPKGEDKKYRFKIEEN